MLTKIVSGGQSGVDTAALVAARECGLETGGWAPRGWKTERGPRPELADYGLREFPEPSYPARTEANVRDSDATLVLVQRLDEVTSGTKLTLDLAKKLDKYRATVTLIGDTGRVTDIILGWIRGFSIKTLNIGGPRESKSPGIEKAAEDFLCGVFRGLIRIDENVAS